MRLGMELKNGTTFEMSLFTVPFICEPLSTQPITCAIEKYSHLSNLELADSSSGDEELNVDVLIGSEYYWRLVTGEVIRGGDGPTAVHTKLGWVLSGPVKGIPPQDSSVNFISTHSLKVGTQTTPRDLDERLKTFWDLETLGIKENECSVYEDFERSVSFKEGRYEVRRPWKEPHPELTNNYELSERRLDGLLKRLRQSPAIFCESHNVIKDQLSKGIVEIVEQPEISSGKEVHYLPHHAVVREDKATTKLRIVYDASTRSSGPSLNDCLYTGPKFSRSILDIILRFRTHQVALAADIEKAFLMISVVEDDRDVLRFLWIDGIS